MLAVLTSNLGRSAAPDVAQLAIGLRPSVDVYWVEEVLGFMGLGEFIDRMPSQLSGGQRKRAAICASSPLRRS